ncbi:MAG: agmatinase [Alphaproteobacteria bacterium]|nr:agmatinase [Alphaproteobacteria bacterium]
MAEFSDAELHTGPVTFMGAPYTLDLTGAEAAVLGVPFDCGTHPFRIGSRQGPNAIREQSTLVRPYDPEFADFSPVERLGLVDRGNVRLTPGHIVDAFERIEAAARRIHDAGVIPVAMGGDGSISLPLMRAAASRYPGVAALHFDSHTDAYGYTEDDKWNSATQFTHAAEEQCIIPSLSYHVGIRGSTYRQNALGQSRMMGYNIISFVELSRRGFADVLAELRDKLNGRPVYLCFDMDVLDPSCAPGVCTPIWGGLLAREAIELMRGLGGLDIVGIDVNTVSPPHDVNGMTAFLAAQIIYEGLLLLCRRRG